MHSWRVVYNRTLDRPIHRAQHAHALFSPLVAQIFSTLRVSAAVWEHGTDWFPIHTEEPSLSTFEAEHGKEAERFAYNERQFVRVHRSKRTVRGSHAHCLDLFVPIVIERRVAGILATGPFSVARPTTAEIVERWRWLTGRTAHLADPEFAAYLSSVFSTLVLPGEKAKTFEKLLGCLARLMAGAGRADELINRATELRAELMEARAADFMWEVVQTMVDERTPLRWQTAGRAPQLRRLGVTRPVNHVLVGLTVSHTPDGRVSGRLASGGSAGGDVVDEAVRRDAFQRAAVDIARSWGETIAGQMGDHGVVLLCAASGGSQARRQKLVDLAERATLIARKRFDLSVHWGLCPASDALSRGYQAALGAAEYALARGTRLEMAEPGAARPARSLREMREELGRVVEERPDRLGARFDRYLEAVAVHCGYRIDAARGHLEAGFERLARPLTATGALDMKSFASLCEALDRRAAEAHSLGDLFAAYRRAALDVTEAVQKPVAARRDRSLRSAVDHIHQNYTGRVRLSQVARIAGFTPSHFSKLFIERERMSFERYVRGLRLERAKQLLFDTDLPSTRVAELSGFGSEQYFASVFRQVFGRTPLQYRRENPMNRHRYRNKNNQ